MDRRVRIMFDATEQQHRLLKVAAATAGKPLKTFIMDILIAEVPGLREAQDERTFAEAINLAAGRKLNS